MTPVDLARLLADDRPAVVERALRQFSKIGSAAVPALAAALRSPSIEARRNAVWALTRVEGDQARSAIRIALGDRDDSVRIAAIHSAGAWRDKSAFVPLEAALASNRPHVQRSAAEALGRIGDSRAVRGILGAASSAGDRVLDHSLTYALIEIGDAASVVTAGLHANAPRSRRAALMALDQIGGGQLKVDGLVPLLDGPDPLLKETAWWIAARHPEWGGALAGFFQKRLAAPGLSATDRDDLRQKLALFASNDEIRRLLADEAASGSITALAAMAAAGSSTLPSAVRVKELPAAWAAALPRALASPNDDVTRHAVSVVRALPSGKGASGELHDALVRLARDKTRGDDVRLDALSVIGGFTATDGDLFELVLTNLAPERPAARRAAAAAVVEKAKLDESQLTALVPLLGSAGPLELPKLLQAFENSKDERIGLAMISALERSRSRAAVRADVLRPRLANYPESVKRAGETLLASINMDSAKQAQHLESLIGAAQGGDVARGQTVFNGVKGACLSCHAIGYIGGTIGPDLTKIGQVRGDRDLLEAIVYPSASFARGYEPVAVQTRAGQLVTGVLRRDAPDEVILSDGAGKEIRVPRGDITDVQPGTASLMPPGFGDLLTRQELADLLAFLRAAK